jgi:hypothetical protein
MPNIHVMICVFGRDHLNRIRIGSASECKHRSIEMKQTATKNDYIKGSIHIRGSISYGPRRR